MLDPRGVMSVRDWTLWAVLASLMVLESFAVAGYAFASLWTAASVLAVGVAVAVRRTRPLVAFAAVAVVTCGELVDSAGGDENFKVMHLGVLVFVSYVVGRSVDGYRGFLGLVVAGHLLVGVAGAAVRGSYPLTNAVLNWFWLLLGSMVFVVLPWLYGRYRRQHARLVSAGWERAERMESEQRMAVEQARLRERNRIAQDMHDSLGHDLSLIALQAGALEVDDELTARHRRAAGELRTAAAMATERLGDLVGVLRADDSAPVRPVTESLEQIVERARASGMSIELHEEGVVGELSALAAQAAARAVQEGLTNAAKHAPGQPVEVRVRWADDTMRLQVRNALVESPTRDRPASGGHGLTGLEERLRLIGGFLSYDRSDGFFALTARVPYDVGPLARDHEPAVGETSETSSEHDLVRERVRRGLLTTIAAPLAVGAAIGLVILVYYLVLGYAAMLDEEDYDRVDVGQTRDEVDPLLPDVEMIDPPHGDPVPEGATCEYYRSSGPFSGTYAYRLCFEDDVLVSKERVPMGSASIEEER